MKTNPTHNQFTLTRILIAVSIIAPACPLAAATSAAEAKTATSNLTSPPLLILSPTALTGDAGDQRAYLRWNLQLEDERVIGWKVLQLAPRRPCSARAFWRSRLWLSAD